MRHRREKAHIVLIRQLADIWTAKLLLVRVQKGGDIQTYTQRRQACEDRGKTGGMQPQATVPWQPRELEEARNGCSPKASVGGAVLLAA